MKTKWPFLLCLLCLLPVQAQDTELLDLMFSNSPMDEEIYVFEEPAAFIDQSNFFTRDFLLNYTYPVIGVDPKKVKKLIKKLDFNFLQIKRPRK